MGKYLIKVLCMIWTDLMTTHLMNTYVILIHTIRIICFQISKNMSCNNYNTKYQEYLMSFIYPLTTLNDNNKNFIKYNNSHNNIREVNNNSNTYNFKLPNRGQVSSVKGYKRLKGRRKESK